MNNEKSDNHDSYNSLLLLDEIAKGEHLSQRNLSKRLNLALGLVNSYMKNLMAKGYITISEIPAKRYAYYLTPKGFAEKIRLTYHPLLGSTKIDKSARRDFRKLFGELETRGIKRVTFAGAFLQEVEIELAVIIDDEKAGRKFFKTIVGSFHDFSANDCDSFIVTSILRRDKIHKKLLKNGVSENKIFSLRYKDAIGRHRWERFALRRSSGLYGAD